MRLRTLFILFLMMSTPLWGQSILQKEDVTKYEGLFDFYYSSTKDKIYLEVKELDSSFLYVSSLSQGVGSNDIGLDRGQLGSTQIVYFHQAGNKLLLIEPNLEYRANTKNKLERKSVEQAFAKSVLFGFPILEKTKKGYLIDLTPMIMQDTHDVVGRLRSTKQGSYALDKSRSALHMEQTKAFPQNVDFEAIITLKGAPKGREIRSVTPNAKFVTVYQHHTFIQLPDKEYTPRMARKSAGGFSLSYMDYASPIDQDMVKNLVVRHRLKKKKPNAEVSEAVEPIVYYLDNGTPEPVRSALLEGAQWWNQAFEAIGYKNAFQVRILPENVHPLDIRYHVIQWVHRSTRGWSYGGSVVDPRTGEIIKGHVSLGSLRVRQDFLIAQALSDHPFSGKEADTTPMMKLALARIRQLSAHEVGHTLGFAHNFAASTNGRASVMDYPHPTITMKDGQISFEDAYDTGIGEWDKVSVAYAYGDYETDEDLVGVLRKAQTDGLKYISDRDSRQPGGANVIGHLWDNGVYPVTELENVIEVRQRAIAQFSEDNIREGVSYAHLEDVFVPVYFYHRYQTEAVAKIVGGVNYAYRVKGDGQEADRVVSPRDQRYALNALLGTLDASFLAIPKDKLAMFPARGMGDRSRESFKSKTGVVFDALSAASTSAEMTLKLLLHPERANRLVQQKALDENQLGFTEMLRVLVSQTLGKKYNDEYLNQIQQSVNHEVFQQMMQLAQDPRAYAQVKAIVENILENYVTNRREVYLNAYESGYVRMIEQYFEDPQMVQKYKSPKIPDGSPIGSHACGM